MTNENNSLEMKTVVETFLIEETQELIYDDAKLQQWNKHVAELGLKGQTNIVSGNKSPIPFMHMKQQHIEMFTILCPRKVDVKAYDITPIPVEILDLIALSVRENYFDEIQIWYDDKTPDPVCVGLKLKYWSVDNANTWQKHHNNKQDALDYMAENGWTEKQPIASSLKEGWLLGKWADVKASFAELAERARVRFISEETITQKEAIRNAQRKLIDLEIDAAKKFGLMPNHNPSDDLPF